jgi:23S rRNA (guanosine2251-2'-O)-methyltransferase
MIIYGINPVLEAMRAGRVTRVRIASRDDRRIAEVLRLAENVGVRVEQVPTELLRHASGGGAHQGVVAEAAAPRAIGIADLLAAAAQPPLLVVLDGIEDPRNLGAVLRTCEAAGVDGVIRQTRRAAPLGGTAAKASAGAVAHLQIADVVNIGRALEELKASGIWTVGLAGDAERSYEAVDYTVPTGFVIGAEGSGLRRLVRDRCDWLVSIPMRGRVDSLNVSVACGVALFEALRQRRVKQAGGSGAFSGRG